MEEYQYPYSIKTQMPHLHDIIKAMERADCKDIKWRDVRPLMAVINRIKSASTRMPSHLRNRQSALIGTSWDIDTSDPNLRDESVMVKLRLEDAINNIIEFYIDILYGKFALKLRWESQEWSNNNISKTDWTPVEILHPKPWDTEANPNYPDNICLLVHTKANFTRQELTETVDESWISSVYEPENVGGILRSCIIKEWLIDADIQDWRNFNKRAKGLITATYTDFGVMAKGAQENAEKAVREIGSTNWAAVPDSIKFDFLKAVDAVAANSYENYKKALESDIAIALRGASNTAELSTQNGSRSAVEALIYGVEESVALLDRTKVAEIINKQLLQQDYQRNFSKTGATSSRVPWRFIWNVKYAEDAEANMRIATALLTQGVPLYAKELAQKTGFTPATDEDIIKPVATVSGGLFGNEEL